ncbi:cytochrome P450 [Dyadobacter jiangsuensis]
MKNSPPSAGQFPDPFEAVREARGYGEVEDQGDTVTMLLRLKDVRKTAHNWKDFSSETTPGRIVVPSEVNIRSTRQIPFELDPPRHGEYRSLLEAWFKRPLQPEYLRALSEIVTAIIDEVLKQGTVEVVSELALRLQSQALTLLLNVSPSEADTWISWGTHVFRSEGEALDGAKASVLFDYIDKEIDRAIRQPGDDLYSVLLNTEVQGRKMTREEVSGVLNLTFAGGRDTVINAVTNSIVYLAENSHQLDRLRHEPEIMGKAVEELIRYFAPLTHMGRVVTTDIEVCSHAVRADSRVSLCWASANRDAATFENPNDVMLDRAMNPHVSFGFGTHNCLGATHARQVLKTLLTVLAERVGSMQVGEFEENTEQWGEFRRKVGFHRIRVQFHPIEDQEAV